MNTIEEGRERVKYHRTLSKCIFKIITPVSQNLPDFSEITAYKAKQTNDKYIKNK